MRRVTLHFDPSCPWTWLTSRWLLQVASIEGFAVGLAPFSLAHLERDEAESWSDEQRAKRESGQAVLRIVEHLVGAGDEAATHRVYGAWGELAHQQRRRRDHALVQQVIDDLGLDEPTAAAADDASLDSTIAGQTDAALAGAGEGVGSPILEWSDDGATVWIFGPIIDELPDAAAATDLWQGIQTLARQDRFKELKRGRTRGPRMPTP